jgi:hypothetical protein
VKIRRKVPETRQKQPLASGEWQLFGGEATPGGLWPLCENKPVLTLKTILFLCSQTVVFDSRV